MAITGTLASDPSQLAGLNPGANNSGLPGSTLGPMTTGSLGNQGGNPLIPSMPAGQGVNVAAPSPAGASNPYATSGATTALANLGPASSSNPNVGAGQFGYGGGDLASSLQSSGYRGGVGTALSNFLNTGAGFNPQVANALVAALQPQFERGRANLMEQFGAAGAADSSAAGLGLGEYEAQTNLAVGQLLSSMYEQSVQDYMGVLTSAKTAPKAPWWQAVSSIIGSVTGGGVSYSSTNTTNAPAGG